VVCLAGGWVLSAAGDSWGRTAMAACVALAVALNVYFFFKPYSVHVREASYPVVDGITSLQEAALDRIDALLPRGRMFLVSDDAWVRWRILQYYYPGNSLLYIPAPLAPADTPLPVWMIRNRMRVRDLDPKSELQIPACGTIVWLIGNDRSRRDLMSVAGADEDSRVITTPSAPGMKFQIGRYRLATSQQLCPAAR
jgi:hypothetical protein